MVIPKYTSGTIMNTYKINTSSWHYKLVNEVLHDACDRRDFCSYWRGVVISVLIVLAGVSLFGLAFFMMLAMPLYTFFQIYVMGHGYDLFFVIFPWVLWSLIGLSYIGTKRKERRIQKRQAWNKMGYPDPDPQPGLLAMWYQSYKGKFCPMVEFVDE
jgi:hypothetical protein